jgi:hypothetical protein
MGVLYSIYDALVSISVPNDKARAVVDAMEQEMLAQLVTRSEFSAEFKLVRLEMTSRFEMLSRDIQATGKDIQALGEKLDSVKSAIGPQIKAELASFENQLNKRLARMTATVVTTGLAAASIVLGAMKYFL